MASKGFDLAATLADVSGLDTGREQITYIDIDLLDEDAANFYSVEGIEKLAESIEFLGLQQPLRVRQNPTAAGRYLIVSGHRRCRALRMIVDGGNDQFRQVACIVEQAATSPELQELRLIYANSDTRTMTSADTAKQAERVEALLYALKEQGVEFPGRMRDHIAEVCKVSASKLARLKVIRERLHPLLQKYWEAGTMNESTAYACASAGQGVQADLMHCIGADKVATMYEWTLKNKIDAAQKIRKRECEKRGGGCLNVDAMLEKVLPANYSECQYYCCAACPNLSRCRTVCSVMAEKAADLKQQRKDAQQSAKEKQIKENEEKVTNIRMIWQRFDAARRAANKTAVECREAVECSWLNDNRLLELADDATDVKPSTSLPYGYFSFDAYRPLIKTADLFGCSVDFLLGRTEDLTPAPQPTKAEPLELSDGAVTWQPGSPLFSGDVTAILQNGGVIQTRSCWYDAIAQAFYFRRGGQQIDGVTCLGWLPVNKQISE